MITSTRRTPRRAVAASAAVLVVALSCMGVALAGGNDSGSEAAPVAAGEPRADVDRDRPERAPSSTVAPSGTVAPEEVEPAAIEPADEIDEPAPAQAAQVAQRGASLQRPALPAPAPVVSATWEPVALQLVEGAAPPPATPEPVAVPPYNGAAGDFTSNAPGCKSNCITSALLRKHAFDADLDFEITTNVDTRVHIWIADRAPTLIGGVPVFPGVAPQSSPGLAKSWQTTLNGLAYDTTYYVIVRAFDAYGGQKYAATSITTRSVPGPGELVGNGGGCYYQCITAAQAHATDNYSVVDFTIATKVAATLDVAISTQSPGTIGGKPVLPKDETFGFLPANGPVAHGRATGLEADTTYNVVVRATDNNGFTAHAVGQFKTSPLPPRVPSPSDVLIVFEKVTITADGDINPGNRGDIKLQWGLADGSYFGSRSEDTLDVGDVVTLPNGSGRWVRVEPGAAMPRIVVNATEDDHVVMEAHDDCRLLGIGLVMWTINNEDCGTTTNVALLDREVAWINTLPTCAQYGMTTRPDHRCYELRSADMGNDYAEFKMLVSFKVG